MTRDDLIEVLAHELKHCRDKRGAPAAPVVFLKPTEAEAIYHILTALTAPGEGLREAIQAFSDELDDWTNARPVPPVDFMTMQFGPKMVAAWDRVIRALAAPAPQEQAQCPSCDGLLDTAGCTCPAPPASAPEGGGA